MYLLFRDKNIMPMDYFSKGRGEKTIIGAFMEYEIDERRKEAESHK